MDTDELVRRCRTIKINENEEEPLVITGREKQKGEQMNAYCLIVKVLSTKLINREAFKLAISQIWQTIHGVKIEGLGNNIFIFQFESLVDKRRVMPRGPWHFDKDIIVLTEPAGIGDVTKQNFNFTSFWIQIHNIPVMCINMEMARILGAKIGTMEEIDGGINGDCLGKFLRITVMIDISKPLRKYIQVQHPNSQEQSTLLVVYERLLEFCFECGRLGHDYRECDRQNLSRPATRNLAEMTYGNWMRASSFKEKGRNKNQQGRDKEAMRPEGEGTRAMQNQR